MSGGVVTVALGVFERVSGRNIPLWAYLAVLAFFLFLSFYLAWRDARKEVVAAQMELSGVSDELKEAKQYLLLERDHNKPKLHGRIAQIISADVSEVRGAILLLLINIRNQGAPSIVDGWHLSVKSDELDIAETPSMMPETITMEVGGRIGALTIKGREAIYNKAAQPIDRGAQAVGWLMYILEGVTAKQLGASNVTLSLTIYDVCSTPYILSVEGSQKITSQPQHFPGTESIFKVANTEPAQSPATTLEPARAYMGLSATNVFDFERGKQATIHLTFRNGGKTPASEVWVQTNAMIDRPETPLKWADEPPPDPLPKRPGKTYVVPGDIVQQRIKLPPEATGERFDLINEGKFRISVYGKLFYKDEEGNEHCLQWCRFYKPGHDTLTGCPEYNRELY